MKGWESVLGAFGNWLSNKRGEGQTGSGLLNFKVLTPSVRTWARVDHHLPNAPVCLSLTIRDERSGISPHPFVISLSSFDTLISASSEPPR